MSASSSGSGGGAGGNRSSSRRMSVIPVRRYVMYLAREDNLLLDNLNSPRNHDAIDIDRGRSGSLFATVNRPPPPSPDHPTSPISSLIRTSRQFSPVLRNPSQSSCIHSPSYQFVIPCASTTQSVSAVEDSDGGDGAGMKAERSTIDRLSDTRGVVIVCINHSR